MMFGTVEKQEIHKNQHFQEKLMKIEGEQKGDENKMIVFESEKRWKGQDCGQGLNHDKFTISEVRWPQEHAICILCNSKLTM